MQGRGMPGWSDGVGCSRTEGAGHGPDPLRLVVCSVYLFLRMTITSSPMIGAPPNSSSRLPVRNEGNERMGLAR